MQVQFGKNQVQIGFAFHVADGLAGILYRMGPHETETAGCSCVWVRSLHPSSISFLCFLCLHNRPLVLTINLGRFYRCPVTTNTAEKWSSFGQAVSTLLCSNRRTSRSQISWYQKSWWQKTNSYSLPEWSSFTIAKATLLTISHRGHSPWLKNTCITCRQAPFF